MHTVVRCCNMTISSDWRTHSSAHRSYASAAIIIIHSIFVLHIFANVTKYSFIKRIVGIEVIFEWKCKFGGLRKGQNPLRATIACDGKASLNPHHSLCSLAALHMHIA